MTIQAIETRYAGCRFRSRIEARWAVVFDSLGLSWEYEKQGVVLPSGPYLPDFEVHHPEKSQVRHWVEVKGKYPNESEFLKASEFEDLVGTPQSGVYFFYGNITRPDSVLSVLHGSGSISRVGGGSFPIKATFERAGHRWRDTDSRMHLIWMLGGIPEPDSLPDMLHRALTAGRSARFEHGERG